MLMARRPSSEVRGRSSEHGGGARFGYRYQARTHSNQTETLLTVDPNPPWADAYVVACQRTRVRHATQPQRHTRHSRTPRPHKPLSPPRPQRASKPHPKFPMPPPTSDSRRTPPETLLTTIRHSCLKGHNTHRKRSHCACRLAHTPWPLRTRVPAAGAHEALRPPTTKSARTRQECRRSNALQVVARAARAMHNVRSKRGRSGVSPLPNCPISATTLLR
mmetsp:Transcript_29582/g.81238  ORF Transcript_29582/g.81238 Transcript_29582/m.81238 type:complete len:219 (-) Transcript_29582:769-1425(-)